MIEGLLKKQKSANTCSTSSQRNGITTTIERIRTAKKQVKPQVVASYSTPSLQSQKCPLRVHSPQVRGSPRKHTASINAQSDYDRVRSLRDNNFKVEGKGAETRKVSIMRSLIFPHSPV